MVGTQHSLRAATEYAGAPQQWCRSAEFFYGGGDAPEQPGSMRGRGAGDSLLLPGLPPAQGPSCEQAHLHESQSPPPFPPWGRRPETEVVSDFPAVPSFLHDEPIKM